ncbi:MAG: LysR substrate-binding domain-containing protein [Pseudomonadota bacterium]
MGIALLPHYLAEVEIDVGRLVSAYGEPVPISGRYFLVWPERDPVRPQVETFVSWLNGTL